MSGEWDGGDRIAPIVLGVRLSGIGPIKVAFVDLSPGVSVLYGLNGVGKSSVLRGIKAAFQGGLVGGSALKGDEFNAICKAAAEAKTNHA